MAPGGTAPDGTLRDWSEVHGNADVWSLLLGNGLSRNISEKFDYESLLAEAKKRHLLAKQELDLFDEFGTRNFEVVLARLRDAKRAADVLGEDSSSYVVAFEKIREALGKAVREVHVGWSDLLDEPLATINKELRENYLTVYTTSYDLILYWAMGYYNFRGFKDCFWGDGGTLFDPDNCELWGDDTTVYYLHGALHLIVQPNGSTRKLVRDFDRNLLDKIGEENPEFRDAWPLLITEGTSADKMRVIGSNEYLRHVYEQFRRDDNALAVFGHSLSEQDQHLIDAINENPDRLIAISMRPGDRVKLRRAQRALVGRLHEISPNQILFFDSTTHPLGSENLCAD